MFKSLLLLILTSTLTYAQSYKCKTFINTYLESSEREYVEGELYAFKPCLVKEDFDYNRNFTKALLKQERFAAALQIGEYLSQMEKTSGKIYDRIFENYAAYIGMSKKTQACYRDNVEAFTLVSFSDFVSDQNMTSLMHFAVDDKQVFKDYLRLKSSNIDVDLLCLKYIPMLALEQKVDKEDIRRGHRYWAKMASKLHLSRKEFMVSFSKKELVYFLLYGEEIKGVSSTYKIELSNRKRIKRTPHLLVYYFHYKNANMDVFYDIY